MREWCEFLREMHIPFSTQAFRASHDHDLLSKLVLGGKEQPAGQMEGVAMEVSGALRGIALPPYVL